MGHLVAFAGIRILIMTRSRPQWLTARMLLYGEVCQIEKSDISFSAVETGQALANRLGSDASAIHSLSLGWPALIGLAALTNEPAPPDMPVANAMHDFFADELFAGLPPSTQDALLQLSPASRITTGLVRHLLGEGAGETIVRATEAGFLEIADGDNLELHPLLQEFLLRKLIETDPVRRLTSAERIISYFMSQHMWDDAASMVASFEV